MVSDHSENVEFYRYRQSDGSAIAEIEPLAEVGGAYLTKIAQGLYLRVPFLLFDQNCTGALSPGAISLI